MPAALDGLVATGVDSAGAGATFNLEAPGGIATDADAELVQGRADRAGVDWTRMQWNSQSAPPVDHCRDVAGLASAVTLLADSRKSDVTAGLVCAGGGMT